MKFFNCLASLYAKIQSPLSSPQQIAHDLGFELPDSFKFDDFVNLITDSRFQPANLVKFMNRKDVERVFSSAIKKEHFSYHSLYSYYLDKGWVGFYLQFDHENKLRRIYVQHKKIQRSTGVEIGLCSANILLPS